MSLIPIGPCGTVVLTVQTSTENGVNDDSSKASLQDLEIVFDQFPKYYMNTFDRL
jgi:hypothetical protein